MPRRWRVIIPPMAQHALFLRRLIAASVFVCMGGGAAANAQPPAGLVPNPAITSTDRMKEAWWAKRHDQIVEQVKANPNVGLLRSEEHTSELQSPCNLVCRLLLEKKNTQNRRSQAPLTTTPLSTY